MSDDPVASVELFYSYSHKDEDLRDELEKHLSILKRQGLIANWHDRRIAAGSEWAGQIDEHLESAQVILLLVSSDFLASDYCYDTEMARALERHEAGQATVIPVIFRPVLWKGAPFAKLQALPKHAKAVTTWDNQDEAFQNIAEGILAAIEKTSSGGRTLEQAKYYVQRMLQNSRRPWASYEAIHDQLGEKYTRHFLEQVLAKYPSIFHTTGVKSSLGVRDGIALNQEESTEKHPTAPRVFISYSHDSEEHRRRVLRLADRLRADGIDCMIDQYEPAPTEGWPRWMLNQVERANFVLVLCTATYNNRFRGKAPKGQGKGGKWEGAIITQELYLTEANNDKFIPLVFSSADTEHIPVILRGATYHDLSRGDEAFEQVYRQLTGQPDTPKPKLGKLRSLPPRERKSGFL